MFKIKRKTEEERIKEKREKILFDYIKECRKAGFLDETILRKLKTIKVDDDFLQKHFEINLIKEVINMPKATKSYEEEDEEIDNVESESETEETEDIEEDEEQEEKPKKKVTKSAKVENKETEVDLASILRNHEERIRIMEASFTRLRVI